MAEVYKYWFGSISISEKICKDICILPATERIFLPRLFYEFFPGNPPEIFGRKQKCEFMKKKNVILPILAQPPSNNYVKCEPGRRARYVDLAHLSRPSTSE